eukprot:CAMPEP_0119552124 /NCGR_PEP_ID=MMETSP1352-20130426/5209_1 /TAXON_ID=265584 /ORGANISM="Stauroneis constricta, Strain CCMP1120" /LENGTH=95 /DNA_ID=CAMNT_0007598303 /DNA_START=8 /DNA_END=291 /DNA_ORIENTATION=+
MNVSSVVELLASKIDQCQPKLRTALIVASYIQFSFNVDVLWAALNALSTHIFESFVPFKRQFSEHKDCGETQMLEKLLDEAVLNGLLSNTIGSNV